MKFSLAKGPFLRSKRTTTGIMLELFAVLVVVWLTSVVAYSVRFNFLVGLRAILLVLVSLFTTIVIDVLMALVKGKRSIKDISKFVLTSYSYVTSIIFTLCLPVGVSYYVVVIGSIVATLLGKYVFGGFGYNVFNPAIIGRIFVGLAFGSSMKYGIESSMSNSASYDFVSGATVTGSINWAQGTIPEGFDWKTLLFGNYNGAMGETYTLLLLVAGIYLIIRGIINYRIVLSYLVTVSGISLFLGLFYGVSNVFSYTLLHLVTGGLMFGAVFMITDPVTSPKAMNGKIIYGIGAGFLTMLIRVNSSYPEGVMYSIALMNMFTPLIDSCIKGNTFSKVGVKWAVIASFLVGSIGLSVGFNALYPLKEGQGENEDPNAWMSNYAVEKIDDNTYTVSSKGFYDDIKMKVYVDKEKEIITQVELIEYSDHELTNIYVEGIYGYSGYDKIIGNNLNLSFSEFDNFNCDNMCTNTGASTSFDVESGATYTTGALIGNLKAVVETVRGGVSNG